jgi:hypothetical protein
MTRRTLVAAIALIYMILGLVNFCYSWSPRSSSPELFVFSLFPLVGGALAIYAGLAMFRLSEFGRKLVVILLSIRVGINVWTMWRSIPYLENGARFGIMNDLGEIVYRAESPYAYQGFLLVWLILALLVIIFLSQRETKEIFVPEVAKDVEPDIIFEE